MRERAEEDWGGQEGGRREGGRGTVVGGKELLSAFFCLLLPCALPNINDHCRASLPSHALLLSLGGGGGGGSGGRQCVQWLPSFPSLSLPDKNKVQKGKKY